MDLSVFFNLIINFINSVYSTLHSKLQFTAFGFTMSFIDVFICFLIIYFVANLFWKGARG